MKTSSKTVSIALATLAISVAASVAASAQTKWPTKAVTLIIPWAAGGGTDPVARLIFGDMEARLGQPFVPLFRPGAAGTIGAAAAAKAAPDGYTIMITSDSPLVQANFLPDVTYDPKTAFIPIAQLTYTPSALVANPKVPYNTFQEMIDYAKANPGKVKAAFAGYGSAGHLNMSLIQHKTGAKFNIVPYAGSGSQLTDLIAGNVDFGSGFPNGYFAAVQSGQLKFIAQMNATRATNMPDVPATDESSYKGIYGGGWLGAFLPKGTPKEIVDKIVAELNITMAKPEIQQKIKGLGYIIVPATPEQFAKKIEGQVVEVKDLIDKGVFKVTQ